MTQIERNIPFPEGRGKTKYPWRELGVGDSFVYDGSVINAQQSAVHYTRVTGRTFKARTVNEDDLVIVRVWRLK